MSVPVLLLGPAVAAVLLSAAPTTASMFGSDSPNPATVSGDQVDLVKTSRDLVALEPRDHRGDGPTPAPVPGGPVPTGKKKFDKDGFFKCVEAGQHEHDCCIINDGTYDQKTGVCWAKRMGESLPGRPGFPTEAVDTGSPQQGSPPLPPVAVDPGSPQSPPTTTAPPVVRDHRTP